MPTLLKDQYSHAFVRALASAVAKVVPAFDAKMFVREALSPPWDDLELKARMRRLSTTLGARLPGAYAAQLDVLEHVVPAFTGLTALLFPDFVEVHGLDAPARSLPALERFTRYSSSEFAIRPFILRDPDRTMTQMRRWARHADEHVRRLASEGCRPRLPWAMALPAFKRDPAPVVAVIERLRADPSEYVRRSVANNLNDIAKDHPGLGLDLAERWHGAHADTDRLLKHACRTLLKRGDARALRLFGFDAEVETEVRRLTVSARRLAIGETLGFAFDVRHRQVDPLTLRIEYAVDFVRPGGKRHRKVFQVAERTLAPGWHRFERRHRFRDFTTRTHHPGVHGLSVIVNGRAAAATRVTLVAED